MDVHPTKNGIYRYWPIAKSLKAPRPRHDLLLADGHRQRCTEGIPRCGAIHHRRHGKGSHLQGLCLREGTKHGGLTEKSPGKPWNMWRSLSGTPKKIDIHRDVLDDLMMVFRSLWGTLPMLQNKIWMMIHHKCSQENVCHLQIPAISAILAETTIHPPFFPGFPVKKSPWSPP